MKTKKMVLTVLALTAILTAFTQAGAAQSFVTNIEMNAPDSVEVDETFTISGSAEGSQLTEIKVRRNIDGAWQVVEERNCSGSECSIETETSYGSTGDQVYQLKVNADGAEASRERTISFEASDSNQRPNADFKIYPQPVDSGETVLFDASCDSGEPCASDSDGSISSYYWDLDGDGAYGDETGVSVSTSFEESTEVGLRVRDNDGAYDTERKTVQVEESEPEFAVSITETTSPVNKGETLEVSYRIENIGGTYGSQYINLSIGDGGESQKVDSFGRVGLDDGLDDTGTLEWDTSNADLGTYTATVETDDDSASTPVTVDEVATSTCGLDIGELNLNPSSIDEGESTEVGLPVSNEGDAQDVRVIFSGGGDTDKTSRINLESGEEREFSGTLSPSFSDDVVAEVETFNGPCGDDDSFATKSDDVTVVDQRDDDPEADFSFSPVNPEVGEAVEFDASDSSGDIESYEWDFGDGNSGDGEFVENTYDVAGEYPVSLTVTDEQGRTDTETRDVEVSLDPDQCGVDRDSIGFSLQDYVIEQGESTEAEVVVNNDASQDQDVRVEFTVGGRTVDTVEATVSGNDRREFSREVSAESSSYVRAHVETEGSPCGDQSFSFSLPLYIDSKSDEDAYLSVDVEDEDGNAIRGAEVEVEGPEDRTRYTDSYGRQGFSLEPGEYDVEVSRSGYETEERSIELDSGDDREIRFELERTDEEDGVLEVNVRDEDGNNIEDARVEVENGDDRFDLTNSNGFTAFSLHPDRYDVEVSHPNYGETVTDSVRIYEDEVERETYTLGDRDRDGIQIRSTSYDDSVCRGGTLAVDVSVENRNDIDEFVTVTGNGLGSNIVLDSFILDEGETEERRIRFTNVEGDGTETFRIRARNGTSDQVTRSVDVEDCVPTGTPTQDPSSVSMKLSYPISPNRALVGDTIKVSGFVDGVNRRANVEIDVNSDRKARVSTQPDGYYQTYIRADSVGMKTVRARSGDQSASRELEVLPTASVGMVEAPERRFEGETFEFCAEIRSQVDARVVLREDGRLIGSTNDRGRVCFDVDAQEPGSHVYEIGAYTSGDGSTSSTTVEVLETDVEVRSFPDQIASVESGSGMVKVDLYNTKNELTRYDLELEGLPSTWLSQSEKQVVLNPGERREVFFYLTPRDEGTYDPEVIVEARNQEVFRQKVDLETGGQDRPRRKSFVQKLANLFTP